MGLKLDTATLEQLGRARKVIATKEYSTIVDGAGDKAKIEARVNQIKAEYKNSTSDYDKEKLQEEHFSQALENNQRLSFKNAVSWTNFHKKGKTSAPDSNNARIRSLRCSIPY
jgi:hypothetical protein